MSSVTPATFKSAAAYVLLGGAAESLATCAPLLYTFARALTPRGLPDPKPLPAFRHPASRSPPASSPLALPRTEPPADCSSGACLRHLRRKSWTRTEAGGCPQRTRGSASSSTGRPPGGSQPQFALCCFLSHVFSWPDCKPPAGRPRTLALRA